MARETFLFRADTTNAIVSGRQYGIDGNWTGYTSPACLYNKKGSGKVIRVRKIGITPVGQTDIAGNSLTAAHNLVSITGHGSGDSTYNVTKLDSTSASFPSTIEIKTNVGSVTTSQNIFRASNFTYFSPRAAGVFSLYKRNFIQKWKDATTSEHQQLTLRNGEGFGISGGPYTTNTYQYPMTVIMVVRLSDTGATYFIRGETRVYTPYIFTILNNGYTAGNVQVISIEYLQEKPFADPENPVAIQDHTQEIIFVSNAQINAQGSTVTPLKMDSTSTLNSNILCLKDATVVPTGQLNSSYTRQITVGNSLMRVRNAWTEQRDLPAVDRAKTNLLNVSKHEDTDIILREGMGIAYIPSTYDGSYGCYYIDFWFTQENTEANAVYPAVGDVDLSVQYGPTGADYTGTLEQPAVSDVLSGVGYGAGGTEFTGTATGGSGGGETSHVF
jgi:hypothetical protein